MRPTKGGVWCTSTEDDVIRVENICRTIWCTVRHHYAHCTRALENDVMHVCVCDDFELSRLVTADRFDERVVNGDAANIIRLSWAEDIVACKR